MGHRQLLRRRMAASRCREADRCPSPWICTASTNNCCAACCPNRHGRENACPNKLERLTRLRSRQNEYNQLEARLHKEKQFNRKVALNAELRALKTEIDQLGA
jgi:predicted signal transduction protein with EAL and GGDEF domain